MRLGIDEAKLGLPRNHHVVVVSVYSGGSGLHGTLIGVAWFLVRQYRALPAAARVSDLGGQPSLRIGQLMQSDGVSRRHAEI